jgi:thymidylate synthase
MNSFEIKYKELLKEVLIINNYTPNRTGINTYSVFGKTISHNMEEGFPLLTGKKMYLKNFIHELIWMVNGDTNVKYLNDNMVTMWNKWAPPSGDLGPVYGYQLRKFNGELDQLSKLIHNIKTDKHSRRHLVSLWNPLQLNDMVLPPCHFAFQFYISPDNKVSLNVFMRSCDLFVGFPYDFALYATLLKIIAKECDLKPYMLQFNITDCHIYENHVKGVIKYINNPIHNAPQLTYIGNINNLKYQDFTLLNYTSEEFIKIEVAK